MSNAKISQKCDDMWTLRCYDPSGTGGGIHAWYSSLPGDVMAAVDAALEILEMEPGPLLDLPHYKELRGRCAGLDEVIIGMDDGRQFRILVFRGPERHECTLLLGFQRKDTAQYGRTCHQGHQRKRAMEKDGRRARECNFP